MKIVLFCSSTLALPVLGELLTRNMVSGMVVPAVENEGVKRLQGIAGQYQVPLLIVQSHSMQETLAPWLHNLQATLALCMTFPFKIPPALLDIPLLGFFNFHFSLLPAYRGPDPVFWQLKNLEPGTGITLHRMNRYFDRGEIVLQQPMPIVAGETHARCSNRLAMASVGMLNEFLNYIRQDHKEVTLVNQPSEGASYQSRPTFHDVIIRWQHQAAAEIIALVCACNPHYQGAITILRGVSLRLLEAVPLELPDIQAPPGTIVMADGREGIGVLCKDGKGVLIKVLLADDGYVSGSHLALLGIQPGEQFADYAEPTP